MDQDPTTVKQETTPQVTHEVDSNYTKHDIKIPREGKSRTGLIIGIIIAVLLVLCGGLALWFFAWYSNPDQVAYDAINHLIKAENVGFEGGFMLDFSEENSPIEKVLISFDSASSSLPNMTSAKLQLIFDAEKVDGEPRVVIEAQNVIMQDGVIYLQIAGLIDSINSLELDEDERASMDFMIDMLEVIDNEWWQISIPDFIDETAASETQSNAMTEVYQCAVQAMNADMSGEIAAIYKQNQFVEIKPSKKLSPETSETYPDITSGYKAYELSINKEKMASFVNRLPETQVAEDFYACYNNVVSEYGGERIGVNDFDEITAEDVEWPDADELQIFLEISQFGHELRGVYVYAYDDAGNDIGGGSAIFKYDSVVVTAPDNYRPITELFDELSELFSQLFMTSMEDEGI